MELAGCTVKAMEEEEVWLGLDHSVSRRTIYPQHQFQVFPCLKEKKKFQYWKMNPITKQDAISKISLKKVSRNVTVHSHEYTKYTNKFIST